MHRSAIVKALRPVTPIRITPIMFIKSVQNQAKMKPRTVPEQSPRHFPRKTAKNFPKSTKRLQKSTKRLPQMTPKNVFKMVKNGLRAFVSTSKKTMIIWKLFFLPDLPKSSQNAVRVCKNEGPTFPRKAALSSKNQQKMTSLGTPKGANKLKK